MTRCWDRVQDNRPSMEEVLQEMVSLCKHFPGDDEPIVYEKNIDNGNDMATNVLMELMSEPYL